MQPAPEGWYPGLQVKPHDLPSQVALPFAGFAHGVQEAPHVVVLVLATHCGPQAW
jgi:hypothetical protein